MFQKVENKLTIIDLITSSGCIVSRQLRDKWNIVLVDKYVTVSEILKKNLKKYNVSNAIYLIRLVRCNCTKFY